MGLPFQRESLDSIRKRLPQALAVIYDVRSILNGGDRPGLHRENVFDNEDGIRTVISLDRDDGAPPVLHLSFSIDASSPLTVEQFFDATANMHTVLWPDTFLRFIDRRGTSIAIHILYEAPAAFLKP